MKIIRAQIGAQFSSSQSEFFKNSQRIPDRMTELGEFICFYKFLLQECPYNASKSTYKQKHAFKAHAIYRRGRGVLGVFLPD